METLKDRIKLQEFTISDALFGIMKWKWLIISLVILFSIGAYFYSSMSYEPLYAATASMVVNAKPSIIINNNEEITQSASDIYLAQKLVNTFSIILKSNKVMEYVVNDLSLDFSPDIIKTWVQLKPEKDTQVLFVTVTCNDPMMAVNIANSLMKVAPTAMMETVELGSVNVLDEATLPKASVPISATRNTMLASIVGLALGLFFSFIISMLIPKIKNSEDIEDKLVLQSLGEIPHIKKRSNQEILLSSNHVKSSIVESFSMLRTVFQFLMNSKGMKSIVLTSSVEGEGKTTVSINLAMALATSGKSTLLIDGDLRKPTIHKRLGINKSNENIINLLLGKTIPDECIIKLNANLSVIIGGNANIKSSDVLASYNVKALLNRLKVKYDYIIIDTPPVCAVSDALILANSADGVVLVIKQDRASLKTISEIVLDIQKSGANIIGCILNGIKRSSPISSYKKKYYYHTKKNYAYGDNLVVSEANAENNDLVM